MLHHNSQPHMQIALPFLVGTIPRGQRVMVIALLMLAFLITNQENAFAQDAVGSPLPVTQVVITNQSKRDYSFTLELAATRWARIRGLMNRQSLPSNRGMMFVYNRPQHVGIWMRNTLIPLDILFINEKGKIIKLVQNAPPLDDQNIYKAVSPVAAVIELLGGTAERLAIRRNDIVYHEHFGNAKKK